MKLKPYTMYVYFYQMRQEMETLGGEVGGGQTARTARSPNTRDTARGAGQGGDYSVAAGK